ncbi:MAG TPA: glycosyltransferase family 39 protein [Pseudomonadales bacterium]
MNHATHQTAEGINASQWQRLFWLCIITGVLARVVAIFFRDFWLDELWSSYFSHPGRPLAEVIRLTIDDVHPPLYQILLHYWFTLFGFSELAGRSLSLLAGLLAMAGFALLAQTVYPRPAARLATMLFACSSFAILYCAEVRSYQLLLMLSCFSGYFLFARLLHHQRWSLAGYFVSGLLAAYTHYFGVILLASQALIALFWIVRYRDRRLLAELAAVYLAMALAWSPMLGHVLADTGRDSFWIQNPGPLKLAAYLLVYFGGPLALPFLLFPLMAIIRARPPFGLREAALLAAALAILLLPWLAGFFTHPITNPRNIIIALPYWLLLTGFVTAFLGQRARTAFVLLNLLIAILTTALMPLYKGERTDTLLAGVKASGLPLYMVNGGKLDTAGFIATKLQLNPQRYAGVSLAVFDAQQPPQAARYWLACYHTCDAIDLEQQVPPGYRIEHRIEARGVRGLQLAPAEP